MVKAELRLFEGTVEGACAAIEHRPFEIVFEVCQTALGNERLKGFDKVDLAHHQLTKIRHFGCFKKGLPVEGAQTCVLTKCVLGKFIVGFIGIAALYPRHTRLCQLLFKFEHPIGSRCSSIRDARQYKQAADVGFVCLLNVERRGIGFEVIITIGQTKAALAEIYDVHLAVFGIQSHIKAKKAPKTGRTKLAEQFHEVFFILQRINLCQIRLHGLDAEAVEGGGV